MFAVREIDPKTQLGVQVGVPIVDYPGVDALGTRFYIMVTDARPAGPPDSIEEVREQVVKDVRALRGYARLADELPTMRELAVREGLSAVAALFAAPEGSEAEALTVLEGVTISYDNISPASVEQWAKISGVNHEVIRKAVLDAAAGLDPLVAPESLDPEKATLAIPVPLRQAVALIRVRRVRPATIEYYRLGGDSRAMQLDQMRMIEALDFATEWPYSRKQLEATLRWEPVRGATDVEGDGEV
jgi:hypothetical protein